MVAIPAADRKPLRGSASCAAAEADLLRPASGPEPAADGGTGLALRAGVLVPLAPSLVAGIKGRATESRRWWEVVSGGASQMLVLREWF